MSRPDRAAWSAISFALGPVAGDDQRPVELGAFDCRHEVRRALVRRELAEVERVWSGQRRRQRRGATRAAPAMFTGLGMTCVCVCGELRRARPQVRRDGRADRDHRVRAREPRSLAREVRRACRESSAARAATRRRRAAGCTASSSARNIPGRARPRPACESDRTSSRPASSRARCRPTGRPPASRPQSTAATSSRAGRGRSRCVRAG